MGGCEHVYRIFYLNRNGRITGAQHVDASDDGEAVEHLRRLGTKGMAELWDRARRVARMEESLSGFEPVGF